jgi:drug/metabolite transporter (DMT)-like permease
MHNHNENNSNMMWWMMVACVLPVLLLVFAGRSGDGSWFKWAILGAVGLMAAFHLFGIRYGKKADSDQSNPPESKPTEENEHNH